MKSKLIKTALGVGLASGSALAQTPDVPQEFRGVLSPGDSTSIGDLKWFDVFQDEQLQKLVRTAFAQNYDLRLSVARINAARANVGLARSNQFPQFEAVADLTTTRTSGTAGASVTVLSGRSRSFGEAFVSLLTFEIDLFGRRRQEPKAASATLRSTEEDRK